MAQQRPSAERSLTGNTWGTSAGPARALHDPERLCCFTVMSGSLFTSLQHAVNNHLRLSCT